MSVNKETNRFIGMCFLRFLLWSACAAVFLSSCRLFGYESIILKTIAVGLPLSLMAFAPAYNLWQIYAHFKESRLILSVLFLAYIGSCLSDAYLLAIDFDRVYWLPPSWQLFFIAWCLADFYSRKLAMLRITHDGD